MPDEIAAAATSLSRTPMRRIPRNEHRQRTLLAAPFASILLLLAFLAIAVDTSYLWQQKRQRQEAADAAVVAYAEDVYLDAAQSAREAAGKAAAATGVTSAAAGIPSTAKQYPFRAAPPSASTGSLKLHPSMSARSWQRHRN